MKIALSILFLHLSLITLGQDSIAVQKQYYEDAYKEINDMLEGNKAYDFKRAVFLTENAFFNNQLSYDLFNDRIDYLKFLAEAFIRANQDNFQYDYADKEKVLKYASVFKTLMDTIKIMLNENVILTEQLPFTYDFDDTWGKGDWSKMFVSKLLVKNKGNCHSLPYLYKILVEEMGEKAYLSLAPNHIYIKLHALKTGLYNTELTSATFPIDAWLMTSGYIHLDAIKTGIYMDTLNNKQSLTLCLLDLAQGYERKFNSIDNAFTLKCSKTALKYYPKYINALLFQSKLLKKRIDNMKAGNAQLLADATLNETESLFKAYEKLTIKIYSLGYRRITERMYLDWLLDLKENKEKYANKNINDNFKPQN